MDAVSMTTSTNSPTTSRKKSRRPADANPVAADTATTRWVALRTRLRERCRDAFRTGIDSPRTPLLLWGCGAGAAAGSMLISWWTRFGNTLVSATAAWLAILIGVALSIGERGPSGRRTRLAMLLLAPLWAVVTSRGLDLQTGLLNLFPLEQQTSALFGIGTLLPGAVLSLGVGFGLLTMTGRMLCGSSFVTKPSWMFAGVGAGVLLYALAFGVWFGHVGGLVPAMLLVGTAAWLWQRLPLGNTEDSPVRQGSRWVSLPTHCGALFLSGLSCELLRRFFQHYQLHTVAFELTTWACLACGLAFAMRGRSRTVTTSFSLIATTLLLVVLSDELLVRLNLWLTMTVSTPWLIQSARLLQLSPVIVIGFVVGVGFRNLSAAAPTPQPLRIGLASLIGGMLLCRLAFASGLPLARLCAFTIGTALLCGLVGLVLTWTTRTRVARGVLAVPVAALLLLTVVSPSVSGLRAARLLFSTETLFAVRAGIDFDHLAVLSESRPLSVTEGDQGTFSLWRQFATQTQIRQSGVPQGVLSTDPEICPHFGGELLPALLPLTLHPEPSRVLMLGLSSGTPLTASLSFPVQQLDCCEPETAVRSYLEQTVWPNSKHHSGDDPRVNWLPIGPQLAMQSGSGSYDVIISLPDHPSLLRSSGCYSLGYYRHASRKLRTGGVFCQRFPFQDVGPQPMRSVLETVRQVFPEVRAVQASPGDLLILAARDEAVFEAPGFLDRLQAPETSRLLAEMGWDWSEMTQLTGLAKSGLETVLAQSDSRVQRWSNDRFALKLPLTVASWEPKALQVQGLLASSGESSLAWVITPDNESELMRRLGEVQSQRKLRIEYPDEPWRYRKAVKEQVQKNPRTLLHQSSGKLAKHTIHPEDQRRLDYFQALSDAFDAERVTPEHLDAIEDFLFPYDPLITEFCYSELVRLFPESSPRDVHGELKHRLHIVNFAKATETSVRDVTGAVRLVLDHPEVAEDSERMVLLEALLERLRYRWMRKSLTPPKGAVDVPLRDVEATLLAFGDAFRTLDRAHADTEDEDWPLRKQYLTRHCVRPLKSYQAVLIEHQHKRRTRLEQFRRDPKSFEKMLPHAN